MTVVVCLQHLSTSSPLPCLLKQSRKQLPSPSPTTFTTQTFPSIHPSIYHPSYVFAQEEELLFWGRKICNSICSLERERRRTNIYLVWKNGMGASMGEVTYHFTCTHIPMTFDPVVVTDCPITACLHAHLLHWNFGWR